MVVEPPSDEPAGHQRAVDGSTDRSTDAARLRRAASRAQRFLSSAREIIAEKGSTEFTVHEVVDRAKQSLRSFYLYFDGKHQLLLALFEEEMDIAIARLRDATSEGDPLDRLEAAVLMLYETSVPVSAQPLFLEFAQRLVGDHPDEVTAAWAPLAEYVTAIVEEAADAGCLRAGRTRRPAAIVLQAATTTAARNVTGRVPITGREVWEFCLHAIAPDDVAGPRLAAAASPED